MLAAEVPEMTIPVLPLDTNIQDTPELREKVRKAAQPGGIDAMVQESGGEPRYKIIGEGIVVALRLGMKAEAAGMGKQATAADRQAVQGYERLREAAKALKVSWGSVTQALHGSTGLSTRTKYFIGGAVLAVLIPTGIYLWRR